MPLEVSTKCRLHLAFSLMTITNEPFVDRRIILKLILGKYGRRVWIGFIWLGIGTGGGLLQTRSWTFEFHKRRGITWLAERTVSLSGRTMFHGISYLMNLLEYGIDFWYGDRSTAYLKTLFLTFYYVFRIRGVATARYYDSRPGFSSVDVLGVCSSLRYTQNGSLYSKEVAVIASSWAARSYYITKGCWWRYMVNIDLIQS
jgi:hypothetical protein